MKTIELSIVIPCLNEADTLGMCIKNAEKALRKFDIGGEIIVVDNGSTDGSQKIASSYDTKLVFASTKGYGSALMKGIEEAKGKYVVIADADASYDFGETSKFLEKLRDGNKLVMGCRLPSGGGQIKEGAMPFLHKWIGNPLFSFLVRWWFNAPIHDVHCGMRGITKNLYNQLNLHCTGMEFASEMVIKACYFTNKICEVPITLYPDKRKNSKRHLRTFRDGWRHLRFYLLFSNKWVFLIPGIFLILLGLIGYITVLLHLKVFDRYFDVHTLLFSSLFIICGYQSVVFALLAKTFAISEGLKPSDKVMNMFWSNVNLEKGLLIGSLSMIIGLVLLGNIFYEWLVIKLGALDPTYTMRRLIPGLTLSVLGFQTILSSFFASILGLKKVK